MTNCPPINIREIFGHSLRRFENAYSGELKKPLINDDDRAWLFDFYTGKFDGRAPVFRHDIRPEAARGVTFSVLCCAEYLVRGLFDGYVSALLDSGFLVLGESEGYAFLLHKSYYPNENNLMFSDLHYNNIPLASEMTRESVLEMLEFNDPAEDYRKNNIPWTFSLFRDIISMEPVDSERFLFAEKRRRDLLIE